MKRPLLLVLPLLFALAAPARAQMCEPSQINSSLQYLRRLSLDLRGRVPDFAELERVVSETVVSDELVATMLTPEALLPALSAYFRDLLWVNLNVPIAGNFGFLSVSQVPDSHGALWVFNRARLYRGGNQDFPCADRPAAYDNNGILVLNDVSATYGPGAIEEGYVMVHPYYAADPNVRVKVCAFDAQDALVGPFSNTRCDGLQFAIDCGCGPDLAFCQIGANGVDTSGDLNRAFVAQAMRMFERIVREDLPYTDLLLGKQLEINGPISHFLRNQTRSSEGTIAAEPDVGYEVPNIPFSEIDTWQTVTTTGRTAGVLTSPFFLLRNATNRSRGNRFYNAFLCSAFQASPAGLPSPDDQCNQEPNLTKRCGCKDCHQTLEPLAAYWGRWTERGLAEMSEALYPDVSPPCQAPYSGFHCENFYYTYNDAPAHPDLAPFRGMLQSLVFADDVRRAHVTEGPPALANEIVTNGSFARCTVTKLWQRFIGRPMRPEDPVDKAAFDGVVTRFIANNYRLAGLVADLVRLDQYRAGFLPEEN